MTSPTPLPTLLEQLRAAGVREAEFHEDGSPRRLVFEAVYKQPDKSADEEPKQSPGRRDLAHSRLRPSPAP